MIFLIALFIISFVLNDVGIFIKGLAVLMFVQFFLLDYK